MKKKSERVAADRAVLDTELDRKYELCTPEDVPTFLKKVDEHEVRPPQKYWIGLKHGA